MKSATPALLTAILITAGASASAQGWSSEVEAGLFSSYRNSTDTDIDADPFTGGYVAGAFTYSMNDLRFSIDGRIETIDDEGINDVYETGPVHTGVIGLHGGRVFGSTYVGAFVGVGYFDGYDSESAMDGHIIGIEAEHAFASGLTAFGQIGYAEAIGDPGDNEFQGPALRVGLAGDISERLGYVTAFEAARSRDCFEDCGDQWGLYTAVSLELNYDISDRVELVGGVKIANIEANTEDSARATNVYLGLRLPLGNGPRSNLKTPLGAFEAAGWMHPLD